MGNIGNPQRIIEFEPVQEPLPFEVEEPEEAPQVEPEKVPANG